MTTAPSSQTDSSGIERMLSDALVHCEAGQWQAAEDCCRRILQTDPRHPRANHQLGVLYLRMQQPQVALSHFMAALEADPAQGQYWLCYADALIQAGHAEAAQQVLALARQRGLHGREVEALELRIAGNTPAGSTQAISPSGEHPARAGRESPKESDALVALFKAGQYAEAVARAEEVTQRFPDDVLGWKVWGAALKQLGRDDEALLPMRKAVELSPQDAEACNNLGITLQGLGRMEQAELCYRQALQIKPDYAEAHFNQATVMQHLQHMPEAEASYRRALQARPDFAEAYGNLGVVLHDMGRLAEAETNLRHALRIKPQYVEAHSNLGRTLHEQGRLEEAEASFREALRIKPDLAELYSNLSVILEGQGRLAEAETCCRSALALDADLADAYDSLGNILKNMGRLAEAEACYRQELRINPDLADAHSNLLYCLAQNINIDAEVLFEEYRRFGERFETPFRTPPQFANSRDPDRPLRVGFVSGDLRNHVVASFLEPVLERLSGYPQLSLYAYSNHAMQDSTTQRLRGYFAHWQQVVGMSDAALADRIRADGIDILIDLAGHSGKNRLLVFARKPAPVQLSWIGYPVTTGLRAMDYYFADRYFLPPGQFDRLFTEKIVRLPAVAPFLPSNAAPPINPLPALGKGHLTFGSFNRLSKFSREVVSLWAQLLRALPDSRMLLGGMPEGGKYDMLASWFEQEGIVRERLEFHPRGSMAYYLSLHQQVDICLDTFPYGGGGTTLHALWMGVPTLTVTGTTSAGRFSACILGQAGQERFIARDAADFVRRGMYWAEHLDELSDIRMSLRERFARSAMGQPERVAAAVELALRIIWRRWCAGLPPESFEVDQSTVAEATQEQSND